MFVSVANVCFAAGGVLFGVILGAAAAHYGDRVALEHCSRRIATMSKYCDNLVFACRRELSDSFFKKVMASFEKANNAK